MNSLSADQRIFMSHKNFKSLWLKSSSKFLNLVIEYIKIPKQLFVIVVCDVLKLLTFSRMWPQI